MAPTVSASELGYYASPRFCPRCAWVRLHVKPLPYQVFPGIFSSIDRYNKLIVRSHFHRENALPSWLRQLGDVETCITPPHWSRFSVTDSDTGVTLRGEADDIFKMADGSYTIVDYKTSRYTQAQGMLFSAYEAQLNAYAYIGEGLNLRPVSQLALVYMEPITDELTAEGAHLVDDKGFSMGFAATVVPVEAKPDRVIPPLLARVREIGEMGSPPSGLSGCRDCDALDGLVAALR